VLTAVIVAVIVGLTAFIMRLVTNSTLESTTNLMDSLTQEQSVLVLNYVESAERSLAAYGSSGEVLRALQNPSNKDYVQQAQTFTEKYAETVPGIEGIYASTLTSQVIVHNNTQTVGIITNKGEALESFITTLEENEDSVYNSGIAISPTTGRQIISMYKIIYDENDSPVGYVGLGIYTDSLADSLDKISNGTSVSSFQMIDVSENKYIFSDDKSKVGADVSNADLSNIVKKVSSSKVSCSDYIENDDVTSFYYYNSDRGWLFVNNQSSDSTYQYSNLINTYFIAFCAVVAILVIACNIIGAGQDKAMKKLEQAKKKQEAVTNSLYIASMIDPVTNTGNRAKMVSDLGTDDEGNNKFADSEKEPYYFILFNIPNFSNLNKKYGATACDEILRGTAELLKNSYKDENVYRTGSDEFTAVIKKGNPDINTIVKDTDLILNSLQKDRLVEGTSIAVPHIAAVVQKGTDVTPAIIDIVKVLRNANPSTDRIVKSVLDDINK
jgi:diguanylate cyclase (GGDEF)-like protein